MIIGVDIGGTKTLIGLFDMQGTLLREVRFQTNQDQSIFESDLKSNLSDLIEDQTVTAVGVASPGRVESGTIVWSGSNLGWKNFALSQAISELTNAPIFINNDANLAALAEARALGKNDPLVLYITLSTGVGSGVIINGQLYSAISGSEAGQMFVYTKEGKMVKWEDVASGKSLTNRTGMRAEDISSDEIWQQYAEDVCLGLQPTINVLRPQKVILGGGVGVYADKYLGYLNAALEKQINSSFYKIPDIMPAHYGEKSVIYGCYEYAKDHLTA